MAAAPLSAESIELECPVCHEEFTEPKILPCAHILCQACLVTWLDSDMEALCPMCRSTIVDTNECFTKSAQVLAEALPTDLAMAAVVKSSAILRENQVCCVCPNVAATSFCLDCNDMLCQACAVAHGKLRVLRHHKLENLTSLTATSLAAKGSAECVAHPHQICSLYCISHGDSICHTCATTKHRSCAEVVEVEDKVKEAQTKLDELLATLKQGEAHFEQAASELDQKLQQVEEASQKDIEKVEKMHGDLKNVLEERCQQIKEMIQKSGSDTKALVCSEKTTIAAKQGKLTSHRRLVERAKESTPSTDLGNMTKLLQLRVKDLDFSLPESQISMRRLWIDPLAVYQIKEAFEELGQLQDISNRTEYVARTRPEGSIGKDKIKKKRYSFGGKQRCFPACQSADVPAPF